MANPLSPFLNARFIQPAVEAGVERAMFSERPPVYGATTLPELTPGQMAGHPHDADYALLYSIYKLNTDVSGCVHKWAGGVTGAGWRITTIDGNATLTPTLEQHHLMVEGTTSLQDV